ncbi:hypothetical protein DPMN_072856 [Dreissena polymorpha]|uniref:Uncharacterized protein n=1 Tax=Dreissena polymorpha TaxID=45954 RepID=A0A9D4BY44_DREPO|nr:hypothetical protein DPMN_072856 [Dreissena polymorpha]
MKKPLYLLVLGNIKGAKDPAEVQNTVQMVQTRAQHQQEERPYRKLKVPDRILDVSRDEFLWLQTDDTTLKSVNKTAHDGQVK